MKGRPITGEEFDRMISNTAKVVGEADVADWQLLLWGLWWSGLRLGEALALRWDQQPGGVCVILSGQKSVLSFDADSQKNGKVELVPLAPEAVELLEGIDQRTGRVFPLAGGFTKVCRTISAIGKAAGVIVDLERGKFASAHDLRRAFGLRWSRRVTPPVLKQLMRHGKIETTLEYYAGQNAESTAEELWSALGRTPAESSSTEVKNTL